MIFNIFDKLKKIMGNKQRPAGTIEGSPTKTLQKKFLKKDDTEQNEFIAKKNQSMKDSQGVSDFSGSGYNGPGNVDREKTNSNMSQRNFEN